MATDPETDHPLQELQEQRSYAELNEGPSADSAFTPAYDAIRIDSVDGDVQFKNRAGDTQTLSQAFISANETIPLEIAEIVSGGTTQTLANVLLLRA